MFERFKQTGFFNFIDSTERALLSTAVLALNFTQAVSQELNNTINSTNTTSHAPTMAPTHTPPPTLSERDKEMNMAVLGVLFGVPIVAIGLMLLCRKGSSSGHSSNNSHVLQTVVAIEVTNTCCDALLRHHR